MLSNNPDQKDLFRKPLYESREPVQAIDPDRFRLRIKTAMSACLRDHVLDRYEIADEMGRILASESFSKAMLDNYCSPSKSDRDISLLRFKAFVRVTGKNSLWDLAVSDDGLLMLEGDEARFAEIARLEQEKRGIAKQLNMLRSSPVPIKRGK